jgi:hypothetical protein
MQTLPAHRWDFSLTVALLVASFASRIGLLLWLLLGVILPKAAQFVEVAAPQGFLVATLAGRQFAHAARTLLACTHGGRCVSKHNPNNRRRQTPF